MGNVENNIFGWELLYKTVEQEIKSKSDLIILIVHWALIRRGFLCAGTNEKLTDGAADENLPSNWNAKCIYTLNYVFDGKNYILKANKEKAKQYFFIYFNCSDDNRVTKTCVLIDEVKKLCRDLNKCLPNNEYIIKKINIELIDKLLEPEKKVEQLVLENNIPSTSYQHNTYAENRNLQIPAPPMFISPGIRSSSRDISGMLMPSPGMGPRPTFNPLLRDPNLPAGAIPPGARFDPVHPFYEPQHPDPHSHPDHDHYRPPGPSRFS